MVILTTSHNHEIEEMNFYEFNEQIRKQLKESSLAIIKERYNALRGIVAREKDFRDMIDTVNKFEDEAVANFNRDFDKTFNDAFGVGK